MKKNLIVFGLLWGVLATALAADKATVRNKASLMEGAWKVTAVGKQGNNDQTAQSLSKSFVLTFNEKAAKNKVIEGEPFGFELVNSRLSEAKPGGRVVFTTTYKDDDNLALIAWHGKLSDDGTKITDGKFSFPSGNGTFTAEKQDANTEKN